MVIIIAASISQDSLANCPTTEPAPCYDRISNVLGSTPSMPTPSMPTPSMPGNRAEVTGAVAVTIVSFAAVVATMF